MNKNSNIYNEFTESDWKLFRSRIAVWQENYMDRLNKEYIKILTQDKKASDKFWQVDKRIKKDKRKAGVVIDLRRSTMVENILELLNDEVIEMNDLNDFSDKLKDVINMYRSYFK